MLGLLEDLTGWLDTSLEEYGRKNMTHSVIVGDGLSIIRLMEVQEELLKYATASDSTVRLLSALYSFL